MARTQGARPGASRVLRTPNRTPSGAYRPRGGAADRGRTSGSPASPLAAQPTYAGDQHADDRHPDDQQVRALIRARLSGDRSDGFRLGLAVEGGGMRGIVSGGMLLALKDLGLIDVFDAFFGTSSGSVNLAYVHGGAGWEAAPVYYEYLNDGFVRRRQRWNLAKPVLDMDYAFDEVMSRTVPIGWPTVRKADRPIVAVLTNVDRARPEQIDLRTLGDDAIEYVKAAAWMPLLAGPTPEIHGTRYLDGGLLCPDPVYAAIDGGCTHVLLLNTSPQGVWPASPRSRPVLRPLLNRLQPGLGDAYVHTRERWDADRAAARYGSDVTMSGCAVLRVAVPKSAHPVGTLTMQRDVLISGLRAGYQTITGMFGNGEPSGLPAVLQ